MKFYSRLDLFLEKARNFFRNVTSYSFKQFLLCIRGFLASLLLDVQVEIYWKKQHRELKVGN